MSDVIVRGEPRIYSEDSPYSYFADVAMSGSPAFRGHDKATARLERYADELRGELRSNQHSSESRHVLRSVNNIVRSNDPGRSAEEFRAMTTGSGSGLSFVTPEYLVKNWRLYREYPPALMEQLSVQPLPAYGMTANIPALEAAAGVSAQASEGTADTETDPTGGYLSANLTTYSGQITVSQQLLDRSGPGLTFDEVAYKQMRQEYDAAVDTAVINAALALPLSISDSTVYAAATFIPNLFGDIYNASQKLETAAGTKLRATHVFFLPAPWGFIASQTGSDQRPILLPNANPNADFAFRPGGADSVPGGYTGYNFGGVPAFTDGNIPLNGGNAQILVLNSGSLYPFCQGEPTVAVFPQPLAADLQVVIRLYGYAATVVLYASGVCSISGAAYSATPTFAG